MAADVVGMQWLAGLGGEDEVTVPDRTVLDDWEGGHDSEARRVFYVAGSRAQKLLIWAVHRKHMGRVTAILDNRRRGVALALRRELLDTRRPCCRQSKTRSATPLWRTQRTLPRRSAGRP